MQLFARIQNDIVIGIIDVKAFEEIDRRSLFRAPKANPIVLINIDGFEPLPDVGWSYNSETKTFTAPLNDNANTS